MLIRRLFAFLAALVVCATFVTAVQAYPVTARSGTTTVTGLYRPIDLKLSMVDGTDALDYCNGCYGGGASYFNYSAIYGGTFTGYSTSGDAGLWGLSFNRVAGSGFADDGSTITLSSTDVATGVGRLTYLGGGDYGAVPYGDAPQTDDFFRLYVASASPYLQVDCLDGTSTCATFAVSLLQDLQLIGPYVPEGEGSVLDDGNAFVCDIFGNNCVARPSSRVNTACYNEQDALVACGSIPADAFMASSKAVPEPASLALVGVALGGLALVRRRRSSSSRT